MEVLFLKSPTAAPFLLAYNAGDTASVSEEVGTALVEAGIATPTAKKTEKAVSKAAANAEKR